MLPDPDRARDAVPDLSSRDIAQTIVPPRQLVFANVSLLWRVVASSYDTQLLSQVTILTAAVSSCVTVAPCAMTVWISENERVPTLSVQGPAGAPPVKGQPGIEQEASCNLKLRPYKPMPSTTLEGLILLRHSNLRDASISVKLLCALILAVDGRCS